MTSNTILHARCKMVESTKAYMETVKKEFPVGSILIVDIGRSRLGVEVTGHANHWWSSPGGLVGTNTDTGKERTFNVSQVVKKVRD